MKRSLLILITLIVGIFLSTTDAWSQDWVIDVEDNSILASVNGKVTHGDKMSFRVPKGSCNTVQQYFSFYTTTDNIYINQLNGAVVPIELNGRKFYAKVLYEAPFLSGHGVLFTLGSYNIEDITKHYENTNSLKIKILSNDGSIENFKAEDFFDVLHNEWDMTNFANSMNEAKAKCLALD